MVCQKSRDKKELRKRSLPPKKRLIPGKGTGSEACKDQGKGETKSVTPEAQNTSCAASVSADERSIASSSHSTTASCSLNQASEKSLSTVVNALNDETGVRPFISNDSHFVANVLHQRDTEEVLRAARVMLYESYMKALRETGC